ncbi:MAG: rod shape-determining protein [Clostridiales bacterium]|nr:rod shape-determining protein [Clostridiales bacterium]
MAIIAPDIGIDLGTSNIVVYVHKKGIVINEPTIALLERGGRRAVKAIGDEARDMLGRTAGDLTAERPLSDGIIRDYDLAQYMLHYFVKKAIGSSRLIKPKGVITVPCRISPIERRAVRQAAISAGIRSSHLVLVPKPFASAVGSGLDVFDPTGCMIVDVGGGTTEVAVISMGGIVISRSIRVGGMKMDEAIVSYVKREFNMLIGDRTAESVKLDLGSALPLEDERRVTIRGRDLITNLPQTADLTSTSVYNALQDPCRAILAAIRFVLSNTPPELAGDILRSGIYLTGGGALLFGLDQYIASELDIPVRLAKDPALTAAQGVGQIAEHIEYLDRIGKSNFMREDLEEKET